MVRTTRPMRQAMLRMGRVTHPAPESLVPYALGTDEPTMAAHVATCDTCRAEIERLREAAGLLRSPASLDRRTETPECLDELAIADFVEGRLTPEARAPVVAHLLTCARCRSVVKAAGELVAEEGVATAGLAPPPRWRRLSVPLGLAAAAVVLLFFWPRTTNDTDSTVGLREPSDTSIVAPVPIAPRGSVATVDRFVWSSVARVDRFRLRLYNDEGAVLWSVETTDTLVALPDSVVLPPLVTYFWKVEAQTEWRRWAASDLVEFSLVGPSR